MILVFFSRNFVIISKQPQSLSQVALPGVRFRMKLLFFVATVIISSAASSKHVTVSDSNCGGDLNIDSEGTIYLEYSGQRLSYSPCKFEIETDNLNKQICVEPVKFDLSCSIKLLYNGGVYLERLPDKMYNCFDRQLSEWCTSSNTLIVAFVRDNGLSRSSDVELKIYTKDYQYTTIMKTVKTTVYVIVGVVVGVILLIIIITVIVVCCVCNRCRSRSQGTVYRAPQQANATTVQAGGYPQGQPSGYQPQGYQPQGYSAGYQPPPQGYPPPPQGYPPQGYQPQGYQGGYPPAQQQAAYPPAQPAGHPPTEKAGVEASAPPLGGDIQMSSIEPPPYPGH